MHKFPILTTKISEDVGLHGNAHRFEIATRLRFERNGVWYELDLDLSHQKNQQPHTPEDILMVTSRFIAEVYRAQQCYIVTDTDTCSRIQISEEDRMQLVNMMDSGELNFHLR